MSAAPRALLALAAALAAATASAGPALDYQLQCQGCHLADGSGSPGAVPSLAGVGRYLAAVRGPEYLVRVPGSAQSPLSSADLAALLEWMVARFDPAGAAAHPTRFDPAQVERWRRFPLTDVDALRESLLREISAGGASERRAAADRGR